jgi:nitrate reductase NapE component
MGGCFEGNKSSTYVQAEPGNNYTFTNVMITVRESEEKATSWITYLFLFVGIVSLLAFGGLFFAGKMGYLPSGGANQH